MRQYQYETALQGDPCAFARLLTFVFSQGDLNVVCTLVGAV